MNNTRLAILASAALGFSLLLSPVATQAQEQFKIGVVDLKEVFDGYEKQKDDYKSLENEMEELQKGIDEMRETLTKAEEEYEAQRDSMTHEEQQAREDAIESDRGKYRAEFTRRQKDLERRQNRVADNILKDIRAAVRELGAAENYHLILEAGKNAPTGVLYFSTTLNMTQKVVDHLNAKYKKSDPSSR
jgi:Skp family chaperone for outer membrane proteins